jgi:hypothetical protein
MSAALLLLLLRRRAVDPRTTRNHIEKWHISGDRY